MDKISSIVSEYRSQNLLAYQKLGVRVTYTRRTIIESGGAPAECIYLITQGHIRQYFIDKDGVEKTLLLLTKGDMFGEVTCFQQDEDQVITQALSFVSVRKIMSSEFLKMLKSSSELLFCTNLMLSNKLRILMAQIHDSSFCDTTQRLKNLLIRLSKQQGVPTANGIKIKQYFTHEELAGMISSTRSTVSKKMKVLEKEGFIRIIDRHLYVQDETQHTGEEKEHSF